MNKTLRLLILEDVPTDAALMENELTESGMNLISKCVVAKASFTNAITEFSPDLILSDYSLPSFNGLSALKIAREKCPDVPFIFVSGALGEEMAIDLLKKGATDYVLKNRLSRLAPAVARALHEIEERNERIRIENALKESEIRYRTIFENTGTATIIIDGTDMILLANKQFEVLSGFLRPEIEGKKRWTDFIYGDDPGHADDHNKPRRKMPGSKKTQISHELKVVNRRGGPLNVLAYIAQIPSTDDRVISILDITARKSAQEALKSREQDLELKSRSLEEANTALKVLLKHRDEDKTSMEEQVLTNVKKLIFPYIENLKHLNLNGDQMTQVEIIESHLNDIISPFLRSLSSAYSSLTPREIQVASLVKEGKTTKEITKLLNISATAVDFHRKNLRLKFGLKNKNTNLRSYLTSLST
ncbi:MAG: PAS domain S-box protein [Syntrophales bacterium]|jgi:PAS domain S-box-containing protein